MSIFQTAKQRPRYNNNACLWVRVRLKKKKKTKKTKLVSHTSAYFSAHSDPMIKELNVYFTDRETGTEGKRLEKQALKPKFA